MEARLADSSEQSDELLGHSEDMLAICGSRMYVFFLDAAVIQQGRLAEQNTNLSKVEEWRGAREKGRMSE